MASPAPFSVADLEALFLVPAKPLDAARLARRFHAAFRRTRDIHTALAAVNEHRVHALDYESLLRRLSRG